MTCKVFSAQKFENRQSQRVGLFPSNECLKYFTSGSGFIHKLSSVRRETINPVKTGPTYFQILPQATSRSYSDHTSLSVPQIYHASVAFKISAWPVPLAQNTLLPIFCMVNFYSLFRQWRATCHFRDALLAALN